MAKYTATIIDPIGLHARPASIVVQEANKFESEFVITSGDKTANLKSIMSVMAMGVKTNEEITIEATGADSDKAIASIEEVMKSNELVK